MVADIANYNISISWAAAYAPSDVRNLDNEMRSGRESELVEGEGGAPAFEL